MAKKTKWDFVKIQNYINSSSGNNCYLITNEQEFLKLKSNTKGGVTKVKLKIRCECGNIFETTMNKFISRNKKQCNSCGHKNAQINRKMSYENIKDFIEIDSNSYCKLLSTEYTDIHDKLLIKCKCGKTFKTDFSQFKYNKKRQCNDCSANYLKSLRSFKYENVVQFVEENNCKLLNTHYENANTNMAFQCSCGEIFITTFNKFKNRNKRQCNKCSGKYHLSYDELKEYIETNSTCKLLSNTYNNQYEDLQFQCACGNLFTTSFARFVHLNKKHCDKCGITNRIEKKTKTYNQFKQELQNIYGNKFQIIGKYINGSTKILVKHNCPDCDYYEWEVHPYNLLSNGVCPKCNGRIYRNTKYFKNEIHNLTKGEYSVLNDYIAMHKKVKFKHNCNECNYNEFEMSPNCFLYQGQRCPLCSKSKGEKRIENYLIQNNFIKVSNENFNELIKNNNKCYIPQKEFDGLTGLGSGNLSYDFYLPQYNLLIEYQGEQHEKPIDFKGKGKKYAQEQFKRQQEHDRRKKEYAEKNNTKLLEMWYYDYDSIEEILDKEIEYNIGDD